MQAAYARMQPALRSKCGHLHMITQYKSRVDALHSGGDAVQSGATRCMHAACSLHAACMQAALRSKYGHLHMITQCKSQGDAVQSGGDALHACCMQPACSLHYAEKYALNEHVHLECILFSK